MEHKCNNCDKVTDGYKLTINGTPFFKCLLCKFETPYEEVVKGSSPIFIVKCGGFHNSEYNKYGRK